MILDLILMITVLLLIMTAGVAVLYYKRIKRAQEEYENAKEVVGDIIISFNKQFQMQENRFDDVAQKMKIISSKTEEIGGKMEDRDRQLVNLAAKMEEVPGIEGKVSARLDKVDEKVEDVVMKQEEMMQKIAGLERLEHELPVKPEAKIEAVIPIKREKALAPLTETELMVIETLAAEGGKTAPEIRERIELTREHTARLMKKLYENGYLERDTRKIPYVYRLKKEMTKILKKAEAKTET